ncbi:FliM/FliN family flagellar motor switch protein [Burkholderia ubonensis]|uniref:FliM/FliN family flagellar motor switch protein n=1 Tax=Burkholderia ubonensis TaxID=101571 RepID=UPI0009B4BDDA|nr:FliM/FliN family flagellar motor switch protein [Burkholderia ubonensis]
MIKSHFGQIGEPQAATLVSSREHQVQCPDAISLIEFNVLNRLIAMPGRHIKFRGLNGGRGTGRERAMRLMLDIGGVRTIVYLAGRSEDDQHGWYAFDDISPTQRAQLWALRAGRLKHAFEQAVAAPVSIVEVAAATVPLDWPRVSLRLGGIEIGCWLEVVSVGHALASARQRRMPVLPTLSFLPVKCVLRLRAVQVSNDELRGFAPGDVLVVANDAIESLRGELCAIDIGYRYPMRYGKEGTVMIEQPEISLDTVDVPMDLEDRKIDLDVELATLQMTLGELANLQAGQLLRLAKPASEMTVDIRHRGVCVARGRLIEIGGLIGVRIDTTRSERSI